MNADKRYLALIYTALSLAILVVGLGAFTRLTDAGLGCPDWPGCYGYLSVSQLSEQISEASQVFPAFPVEIDKARNEMLHRYAAGLLGLMIAAIAVVAWRVNSRHRVIAFGLLILVIFQAALGMWTVTMSLMPIVVMAHLVAGFTMVSLLLLFSMVEKQRINVERKSSVISNVKSSAVPAVLIGNKLKILAVLSLLMVGMQIALGGWTSANYAAVVCSEFPICEVDWLLKYDISAFNPISPSNESYQYGVLNFEQRVTIHVTHRIGAILVCLMLLWLAFEIRKPLGNKTSLMLVAVLILQISLGITNVQALLPLSIAVAHNLCGLLLLLVVVHVVTDVFGLQRQRVMPLLGLTERGNHG